MPKEMAEPKGKEPTRTKHGLYEGTFDTPHLATEPDVAPANDGPEMLSGPKYPKKRQGDDEWDTPLS